MILAAPLRVFQRQGQWTGNELDSSVGGGLNDVPQKEVSYQANPAYSVNNSLSGVCPLC